MFEIISIISTLVIIAMAIGCGAPGIVIFLLAVGLGSPLLCSLGALFSK